MKKMLMLLAMFVIVTGPAFAQQDPDDPGLQDSLIVSEVTIDSGTTFAFVRIYAESKGCTGIDSYFRYNLCFRSYLCERKQRLYRNR
jgi:hypothetical protein